MINNKKDLGSAILSSNVLKCYPIIWVGRSESQVSVDGQEVWRGYCPNHKVILLSEEGGDSQRHTVVHKSTLCQTEYIVYQVTSVLSI